MTIFNTQPTPLRHVTNVAPKLTKEQLQLAIKVVAFLDRKAKVLDKHYDKLNLFNGIVATAMSRYIHRRYGTTAALLFTTGNLAGLIGLTAALDYNDRKRFLSDVEFVLRSELTSRQ